MDGIESRLKCLPTLSYGGVYILAGDEYTSLLRFAALVYGYDAQVQQELDISVCCTSEYGVQVFNRAVQNTYFWLTDPEEAVANVAELDEYQEELHHLIHKNERIMEVDYWSEFPTKFRAAHFAVVTGNMFGTQSVSSIFQRVQKYAESTTTAIILCVLEKDIQNWTCPTHVIHFDMTKKTVCCTQQNSVDRTPVTQLSYNGLVLREK